MNIQILSELGVESGILWLEGRDLKWAMSQTSHAQ